MQRALMQKLGRGAFIPERGMLKLMSLSLDVDMPDLPVEHDILDKLKERVALARKIDNLRHRAKKVSHEKSWLKETAEALEIELDSDGDNGCAYLSFLPMLPHIDRCEIGGVMTRSPIGSGRRRGRSHRTKPSCGSSSRSASCSAASLQSTSPLALGLSRTSCSLLHVSYSCFSGSEGRG